MMENNYLYHHGILGQKWGVRRFQNEDGSLTPQGKRRYSRIIKDARSYGDAFAELERETRKVKSGVKPGSDILVTPEYKDYYTRLLNNVITQENILNKKYSEVITNQVSMDDGYDYIQTLIKDNRLNGNYLWTYSLIEPTKK